MKNFQSVHLKSHFTHLPSNVLVLVGPTASGKTPVSLHLSRILDVEVISADSRQIYKMMDVGTAKATLEERGSVKHYFVDELFPDEEFNAGEFGKRGRNIIEDIIRRKKTPLVVGGSGLYVQALVDGFFDGPSADTALRHELYDRIKKEGAQVLLNELRAVDPASASKMSPINTRRIVRALEVFKLTGIPLSQLHQDQPPPPFAPVFVGLEWDRAVLYDRINRRVDWMIAHGLIHEARRLRSAGYANRLNALQTVGYKEAFDHLDDKISHERMVELIKQNSRRYAKRQLTWFRRDVRIKWFPVLSEEDFSDVTGSIADYFRLKSSEKN
jgi:tRNA dimethylallyltransferase